MTVSRPVKGIADLNTSPSYPFPAAATGVSKTPVAAPNVIPLIAAVVLPRIAALVDWNLAARKEGR